MTISAMEGRIGNAHLHDTAKSDRMAELLRAAVGPSGRLVAGLGPKGPSAPEPPWRVGIYTDRATLLGEGLPIGRAAR